MEVARHLVTGASNAEIARELVISPHTVKVHLRNIFEKLQVNSRTEASMLLVQRGWLAVPGVALPSDEYEPPPEPLADSPGRPAMWQRLYLMAATFICLAALWIPSWIVQARPAADLLSDVRRPRLGQPSIEPLPRWEARTPLGAALSRLALVALGDRLYAIGGEAEGGRSTAAVSVYDLLANDWRPAASLPLPLANAAAAAADERIYVAGGNTAEGSSGEAELHDTLWIYDPEDDAWSEAGTLPGPLAGAALAADAGALYLVGGWDGQSMRSEIWRLALDGTATPEWTLVAQMDTPRAFHGAALVGSSLYVVGGFDGRRELGDAALYSLESHSWRTLPPLSTPRSGLSLVYDDLAVYALGGGSTYAVDTHERYDPTVNAWTNFPSPVPGEWRHLGAAAHNGRLHLIGGWSGDYLDIHLQYQSTFRALLPVISND